VAENVELEALLIAAGEAPPESRIMYRDPIAAHGEQAIQRLAGEAWLLDSRYGAFSIRTIRRAGELGARQAAVDALRAARSHIHDLRLLEDLDESLTALGAPKRAIGKGSSAQQTTSLPPMSVDDLVVGSCYERRSLHLSGLGGNYQKGISYPADGTHVLLFSDPSKASEHGYKDQPSGDRGYRYFGEWDGAGDMSMTGGNRAIVDRSPELYLFTAAACGHLFRGRFELVRWDSEQTSRDGRGLMAIVFTIQRADVAG
jgi:hypothetical protein